MPGASSSALGGTRTPNLLIRSQMLYPLSHERWPSGNYTWQALVGQTRSLGQRTVTRRDVAFLRETAADMRHA